MLLCLGIPLPDLQVVLTVFNGNKSVEVDPAASSHWRFWESGAREMPEPWGGCGGWIRGGPRGGPC